MGRKLEAQVNDCALQANKLFADVLNRKERADSARNALSVLQRFKFLFFLPSTIDKHLDKVNNRVASKFCLKTSKKKVFFFQVRLFVYLKRLYTSKVFICRN